MSGEEFHLWSKLHQVHRRKLLTVPVSLSRLSEILLSLFLTSLLRWAPSRTIDETDNWVRWWGRFLDRILFNFYLIRRELSCKLT